MKMWKRKSIRIQSFNWVHKSPANLEWSKNPQRSFRQHRHSHFCVLIVSYGEKLIRSPCQIHADIPLNCSPIVKHSVLNTFWNLNLITIMTDHHLRFFLRISQQLNTFTTPMLFIPDLFPDNGWRGGSSHLGAPPPCPSNHLPRRQLPNWWF